MGNGAIVAMRQHDVTNDFEAICLSGENVPLIEDVTQYTSYDVAATNGRMSMVASRLELVLTEFPSTLCTT